MPYITKDSFIRRKAEPYKRIVYRVLAETNTEVMVEQSILFADGVYHLLNVWWSKSDIIFCNKDGTTLTHAVEPL